LEIATTAARLYLKTKLEKGQTTNQLKNILLCCKMTTLREPRLPNAHLFANFREKSKVRQFIRWPMGNCLTKKKPEVKCSD
jgi:hypothetical protein